MLDLTPTTKSANWKRVAIFFNINLPVELQAIVSKLNFYKHTHIYSYIHIFTFFLYHIIYLLNNTIKYVQVYKEERLQKQAKSLM